MAKTKRATEAENLVGGLQLARIQLTKAESNLVAVKERARMAKRRRKEAKVAARRAKKEVKRAKTGLSAARVALAMAEVKLARAGKKRVQKLAKSPIAPSQIARSRSRKAPAPVRKTRPALASPPALVDGQEVSPKPETLGSGSSVVENTGV